MIKRLRHRIALFQYKLAPTNQLIERVAEHGKLDTRHNLVEALKERLAHQDGSLEGVDWSGLALNNILLSSCRLARARFYGSELRAAYFGYSDLVSASFTEADLQDAHFREAQLLRADFSGANLRGANFARANLQDVSFAKSDLTGANFWGADLRGADFRGALLQDCNFVAAVVDANSGLHADLAREMEPGLNSIQAPQD